MIATRRALIQGVIAGRPAGEREGGMKHLHGIVAAVVGVLVLVALATSPPYTVGHVLVGGLVVGLLATAVRQATR